MSLINVTKIPAVVPEQEYQDFSKAFQTRIFEKKQFVKAQFELTYGCNLHCLHCYTDPLNTPELLKKELSFEEVTKVIDQLHEEGILWLCFTGGEVFMRRDFLKIYDYASNLGFLITLFTNGTMITESVANHLAARPPFSIEVSFHGATAETFDHITQVPGSFQKCVEGIHRLLDRQLPVKLKTSAMSLNHQELPKIKQFVEALGLKYQVSGVLYPRLDGDVSSLTYRLDPKDIIDLEFEKTEEVNSCEMERPSDQALGKIRPSGELYRCGCGKLQTHIDPYGKVGACTWSRQNRFDLKTKTLQTGMGELAHHLHSQKYPANSVCYSCEAAVHCEKVVEMAHLESGSTFEPVQHFCDLAVGRLERTRQQLNKN